MGRFSRAQAWAFPNMLNRLPEHYYRHRTELQKPSTRVHDRPPETDFFDLKYNDRVKRVERVPDVPIEVMYPKEADLGLWGGEGIVKGYVKPRKYFQAGWPRPKFFFPELKKAVLYSEILDKHFTFICTGRTLALVDEHHGLDGYILRTPVQDLKSQLALQLRREMLLTLLGRKKKTGRDEAHGGVELEAAVEAMPNQRQSVSLLTWPQRALLFYFSPARSLLQLRPFHLHSPWSHQVVSTAATMSTKNASTLGAAKITGTANGSTAPPTNINNTTATTINTTTSALPGKKVLSGRVYFIPGGYSKLGQVIRGTTLTNDRKRPLVEDEVVEIGSSSSSKSTPDGPPAAKVQVKKEIKKETKREVKNEIKREVKKVIIVRSSPAPFLPQTAQQQLQSTVVQARTQTPVRRLVHMSAPIQRFTIPFTQAFTAHSTQNLNQTFTPPSTQTFTSPSTQTFTPPFTQTFAPSFTPNFPSTPTPPLVPFQSGLYRLPLNQLYVPQGPVQTPFKVPTAPAKKTLHYSIARQQKILQAFKETLGVTPPGYSPTIGSASDGPSGSGGGCSSSSDNKNGKWIFQRMADFVKDVEKFKLSVCQLLDPGQVSVTLKTGSWLEALILRSCWYSHKSAEVKRELFPNSRQPVYFDPECHYQIALRPDGDTPTNAAFLRKMDDFMQVLAQLQLDETELSLLTAWLIFEDQPFECNCFPAVKVDEDAEEQLFLTAHQQPSTVSPNVPQVNLKQTIHVLLYEYQAKAMKSTAGGSGASSSTSMPMSNTYRTMNVLLAIAELAGISFLLEV